MKTTADCKQFLGAYFSQHPEFAASVFRTSDPEYATMLVIAKNPAKWRRQSKRKPEWCGSYDAYDFHRPRTRSPSYEQPDLRVPAEALVSVREFALDPEQFETAVMFTVLETRAGELLLGEFVGD